MGERGVIPKRSDERIRRNKDPYLEKITAIGAVEVPDLDLGEVHPLVSDFYESLKGSAQSRFYEPSDWAMARLTMHALNDALQPDENGNPHRISATMLATINTMLSSLLVTEGDRRRVRLEVERDQANGRVLDVAEMFRQRLQQG